MTERSEFGKGCVYCIGLFLAHEAMIQGSLKTYDPIGHKEDAYSMWFYGASDHLYEIVIPDNFPDRLKERIDLWSNKCMHWRLPLNKEKNATEKDWIWAIGEAKGILLDIDNFLGVETEEAEWK